MMGPRKRARPNPTGESPSKTAQQLDATSSSESLATKPPSSTPVIASLKQVRKTGSWYGSWPGTPKTTPPTSLARETILGDTLKPHSTPDFRRFEPKKSIDYLDADMAVSEPAIPSGTIAADKQENHITLRPTEAQTGLSEPTAIVASSDKTDDKAGTASPPNNSTPASSGWFGWIGRTPTKAVEPSSPDIQATSLVPTDTSVPAPSEHTRVETPAGPPEDDSGNQQVAPTPDAVPKNEVGYWFGIWKTTPPKPVPEAPAAAVEQVEHCQPKDPEDTEMEDALPTSPKPEPEPSVGSTWTFWSRDTKGTKSKEPPHKEPGELDVGTETSDHLVPTEAMGLVKTQAKEPLKKQAPTKVTPSKPEKSNKRARPESMDVDPPSSPSSEPSKTPGPVQPPPKATQPTQPQTTPAKALLPNLLLPSFRNTYRMKENPSILKRISDMLLWTKQAPVNHVFLTKTPRKIKKAVAIGVHGLFPAAFLRTMIGQPTGTSIKFANHGAAAIRRWADSHGCEDCEIEMVALEGEGKIADRVDNLWKLLLNWVDKIKEADFILMACHSQGVPVSVMLAAKLIDLGVITSATIGICAMAGVSLGPFPDYKSSMGMLMGSAAELWQFADPQSEVSLRYMHALTEVLNYGVRVTYIGSIDDQLVPLESAVYSVATHPYIYRAVFIDGRVHAPDFIAHLVEFALKLRNLGISDHGLVKELSGSLAGSLYSGEGHSRLYDDEQIYDLAVMHALETTSVKDVPVHIAKHEVPKRVNEYHLPWVMRGVLEEVFVKTELTAETAELLRKFDAWKPASKALKDVKMRLESVRSKL